MKKILVATIACAAAWSAHAQNFYVGAGLGLSQVTDFSGSLAQGLVSELGGSASVSHDKSVRSFRLSGGYVLNEHVALEVGYLRTSDLDANFSGRAGNNVNYSGIAKVSYSGLDLAFSLRPSIASGYNNFFALAGVHNYEVKLENTIRANNTVVNETSRERGIGTLFGFGYDWNLNKEFTVRPQVVRLNKLAGTDDNATH